MHSPGSYSPLPPREPQSTPTQNCEININHEQRTPGWIFKMFTVGSIFIRFPKLDHQNFSKAIYFLKKNTKNISSLFFWVKTSLGASDSG